MPDESSRPSRTHPGLTSRRVRCVIAHLHPLLRYPVSARRDEIRVATVRRLVMQVLRRVELRLLLSCLLWSQGGFFFVPMPVLRRSIFWDFFIFFFLVVFSTPPPPPFPCLSFSFFLLGAEFNHWAVFLFYKNIERHKVIKLYCCVPFFCVLFHFGG